MAKKSKPPLFRTTVSLDNQVVAAGREKASANGQSFSSYINILLRKDLRLEAK